MILIDTSVWIDHQRGVAPHLTDLILAKSVILHPGVIGELACGSLPDRTSYLEFLRDLPQMPAAEHDEVLFFLEMHQFFGKGAGYIDLQLLASAFLNDALFWTNDKRLAQMAIQLNIAYKPTH